MSGPSHGQFVWYELMTTDAHAAKQFYARVVGWSLQPGPVAGLDYTMLMAGDQAVAGLIELPAEARKAGARAGWIGYVGVDDVDAATAKATQLGASVRYAPTDIPTVGRFAIIGDPQGAGIALFKWASPMPNTPAAPGTPGHIGWRELLAVDQATGFDFYGALFGWQKLDAMEVPPIGTYQIFSAGDGPTGGMFTKPAMIPIPFWLYYFNVGNIDDAAGRVKQGGGQVLNGPLQVPSGDWILQGLDPQGAMFSLLGKRG